MTFAVASFDLVDLLRELGEPFDDVPNFIPNAGGCGKALLTAVTVLVKGTDAALDHLLACGPCREALLTIGHVAGGADAILYFERQAPDVATPQSAELATAAL